MKYNTDLTQAELKEHLHYNPDNGIFTRIKSTQKTRVGDIVGTKQKHGHLMAGVNRKKYLLHRLAWLYMTGNWPSEHIDHINGNPSDNRWVNIKHRC